MKILSKVVNFNTVKGLADAKDIFLDFCNKVSLGKENWTTYDFYDYIDLVKAEVDRAYRGGEPTPGVRSLKVLDKVKELHQIVNACLSRIRETSEEKLDACSLRYFFF